MLPKKSENTVAEEKILSEQEQPLTGEIKEDEEIRKHPDHIISRLAGKQVTIHTETAEFVENKQLAGKIRVLVSMENDTHRTSMLLGYIIKVGNVGKTKIKKIAEAKRAEAEEAAKATTAVATAAA